MYFKNLANAKLATWFSVVLTFALSTGIVFAQNSGALYTTTKDGAAVNANVKGYVIADDVYISGGPQNQNSRGLTDGAYYFQVTDPSGKTLLSTDNAVCRQVIVAGGRITGTTGGCPHTLGTLNPANGSTPVQLAPFSKSLNSGGEYKAWLIIAGAATISPTDPKVLVFNRSDAKTDNFKLTSQAPPPPSGSCQPSSSLSVMVQGTNVTSYVPKGAWLPSVATGVSVVNVEGSVITPTLIPTSNVVNSCASDPVTGKTVCSANNTDVYVITGTTLTNTLTSAGIGVLDFSGGTCTNCGVAMDATHGKAVVAMARNASPGDERGGFQFLNLASLTFEPAFASQAPISPAFGNIAEDILVDPTRNLILSPNENGNFELVNVTTSTSPTFFENALSLSPELNSAGEDCTTGIALAPVEFSNPSEVYIADLTQASQTSGSPGTWTAPSQIQSLSESILPCAGASGIAVAQGTHIGIVSDEFGCDGFTAITLPATSGSGTPAIQDWMTCNLGGGFLTGLDPHTVTAYMSPANGHAIALLANDGASTLAVIDLTNMLNPTIVPRTVGGHACTAGSLPASVVRFIPVP